MTDVRSIPKSALAAFSLLLAKQEQERQELARIVCDELGVPHAAAFDIPAGTVSFENPDDSASASS